MEADLPEIHRRRILAVCGATTISVGGLVLIGWHNGCETLKSLCSGFPTMKPNAAVCLSLAGIAVSTEAWGPAFQRWDRFAKALAAGGLAALAGVTLVQYAWPIDLGIDQLLYLDTPGSVGTSHPGRMAPATAVLLLLFGSALLVSLRDRLTPIAEGLSAVIATVAALCILSYAYGADVRESPVPFSSVAIHTAALLMVVAAGFGATLRNGLLWRLLSTSGTEGTLIRRVLPAAILIPPTVGGLRLAGERMGWYGLEFGLALFALSNVAVFSTIVVWAVGKVHGAESLRRVADRAVRESEERNRVLLNALPQMVWTMQSDHTLEFLNPRAAEYFGLPIVQLNKESWTNLIHADDLPHATERLTSAVARGEPHETQLRLRHASGEYRWMLSRVVPLKDGFGRVVHWIGTSHDVHDRILAEQDLIHINGELERRVEERTRAVLDGERRFRAIFHSQFQFIGLLSPDGVVLEANRTALAAAGITESEVVGKPFWETVWWTHNATQQERLRAAVKTAAAGQQIRFEASHPTPTGELTWVDFSLTPFIDDDSHVVYLIPEGRDISDRKRSEQALQLQEERFRSAFENAPIGFALVAPNGRWLRVNRALCEIVGYSEEELLVTDFQSMTHPDDLQADLDQASDLLAGRIRTYQMEKRYFHKRGSTVDILLSVSLVRDADGKPLYFISQIKDITVRKRQEQQLRASLGEKDVMLKEIHHRVKNNLQIVSTLLDLQSEHTDDERTLQMFGESRSRVRSMALIHERLYRSSDLASVDFAVYIRNLAADLYAAYGVTEEQIALEVETCAAELPIDVAIPCGLLLNELMSNCLKHAFPVQPEGSIRVTLTKRGQDAELTIADNGVGLPPDFDIRKTSSFGMQLVVMLTEQLGGEVCLNRTTGSEFIVTFPVPMESAIGAVV